MESIRDLTDILLVLPEDPYWQELEEDLHQKVDEYMLTQAQNPYEYLMIFTDNAALWKKGHDTLTRTHLPLPPIPAKYGRTYDCDIIEQMEKIVSFRLSEWVTCVKVHWCLYNLGDVHRPQVHIIFAPKALSSASKILKRRTDKPMRWYRFSSPRSHLPVLYNLKWSIYESRSSGRSLKSVDESSTSGDHASNVPADDVARPSPNTPGMVLIPQTPSTSDDGSGIHASSQEAPPVSGENRPNSTNKCGVCLFLNKVAGSVKHQCDAETSQVPPNYDLFGSSSDTEVPREVPTRRQSITC